MALKACMNGSCGSTSSIQWKKGWGLRSGGSAILCDKCGSAYEQSIFCDTFHLKETGWRKCNSCSRRLHCGCIASKSFLELLDNGGVECITCARSPRPSSIPRDEEPNGCSTSAEDNGLLQSTSLDSKINVGDSKKRMPLGTCMKDGQNNLLQSQKVDTNGFTVQINREQTIPPVDAVRGTRGSSLTQPHNSSSQIANGKKPMGVKIMYDPIAQTSLNMAFGAPSGTPDLPLRGPGVPGETRETSLLASSFKQGQNSRQLLMKPLKICPRSGSGSGSGTSKDVPLQPQIRIARPPVEGRGKNQLLPRYWPRITDQELQQISVDSNSTVVPLFEKILSASDAGRIGRLVLPKACAEAYFPPISQPEGLPLRIQDVKGNEWVFQFRFWPNNNSRMYVLEGVTPCIQAMQLQAGDTVIFSRKDPEEKLIMGFRKTSNSAVKQDTQISAISNGTTTNGAFFSGAIEKLPGGYTGRLQSLKASTGLHLNTQTGQLDTTKGNGSWCKTENHGAWPSESLTMQPLLVPEKKRSRIIGSKSKRLVVDNEDAMEMKVTWEEAQHMLRPPPTVKPSIVIIEGHEFEEYEEPPVFGKKTIFTAHSHGEQNQWAQCDSCSRWRKLPADVLVPPNWTCADNAWDPPRCSCSAPDEMSAKELEHFLRTNMDTEKWSLKSHKSAQERDRSALDELATIAVLGDSRNECSIPPVGTTTKHPRHRPGCTCIVCIQPPSGKGTKHLPTCKCNVCMTVKRRFETLMMRKKKRQELEEIAQRNPQICSSKDEAEQESASKRKVLLPQVHTENEAGPSNGSDSGSQNKVPSENSKGQIDLNCDPGRDEDFQAGSSQLPPSMMGLLQVASLPLETYLKRNGMASLACEPQPSSSSHVLQQATENSEGKPPDTDREQVPLAQEHENDINEGNSKPDETQNNTV